jgi:non-ribosomal peptide synthetase component F
MLMLPSIYNRILSEARPEQLKSLRVVVVAGEACTPEVVERHFQCVPEAGLFNEYGPTEGTVWSTVFKCSATNSRHISIGKPIPNVQVYILDPRLKPVPIGVAGELYIGGSGIARGYRNRADLTGQRFIPDPFSGRPEERLYRTGDLARFLADGNIEFLGRMDHQVKIRGFRIELEEIESLLSRVPVVEQAVVVARKDDGEERLVAYVVARRGHSPTTTDLRDLLSRDLPDYMIPSVFVVLDALPLTPNGKVDRRALPAPDRVRPQLRQAFVAPRNAVEQLLAEIWAEALQVERVGVDDNFLELGGHSILATRLVSQIREILQFELPLRSLFENPTIAQLAQAILSDAVRRPRIERIAQTALEVAHADENEIGAMMNALSARTGGTSLE